MRLYYKIKNKLLYDVDCLRARWQRFKRGYSYGDVWDIDCWFMRTVKPMLIHLRDHGCGIPFDLYLEGEENERTAWEAVITEMIDCLTLMDEDEAQKYLGIADEDWSVESYNEVNNLMDEKKNRFFDLFCKHFYSLWD